MKSLREGMEEERVVYFGDSTTDQACLVEADLGVVMADDGGSKLLKTLERINLTVPHVGEARAENKLVWARDFQEVLQSGVMDRI
jgi:soluble P-type ATPase